MKILDCLTLTDEQQWELIWDKSIFIVNFKSIDCKFQLRSLGNFFVELELDLQTDAIISKNFFVHGPRLEKYVDDNVLMHWPFDEGDKNKFR